MKCPGCVSVRNATTLVIHVNLSSNKEVSVDFKEKTHQDVALFMDTN